MHSLLDIIDIAPVAQQPTSGPGSAFVRDTQEKMICLLVALGEPLDAIARKLSVDRLIVETVARSQSGVECIIRMQTAAFPDPAIRVKRMANLALDRQLKLMMHANDNVAAGVARDILDRSCGKPTQVTENRNINFSVQDVETIDKQLVAQNERLKRLETIEKKILAAQKKK